jgi:hypothetical protein
MRTVLKITLAPGAESLVTGIVARRPVEEQGSLSYHCCLTS